MRLQTGVWLGQVGLRTGLGVPPPVPAPRPVTIYAGAAPAPVAQGSVDALVTKGPRLEIEVGVPASVADYYAGRGMAVPSRQTVRALIDSGASISGIKPGIARAAGLVQISSVGISSVLGMETRPIYAAAITLPEYGVSLDVIRIAGVDLPQQDLDLLIGRDVLSHLTFTYSGRSGSFNLQGGGSTLAAGGVFAGTVAGFLLL